MCVLELERLSRPLTDVSLVILEQAEWAAEITSQIKSELMKLQDGRDFEARIRKMIEMDRHYVSNCHVWHR